MKLLELHMKILLQKNGNVTLTLIKGITGGEEKTVPREAVE